MARGSISTKRGNRSNCVLMVVYTIQPTITTLAIDLPNSTRARLEKMRLNPDKGLMRSGLGDKGSALNTNPTCI